MTDPKPADTVGDYYRRCAEKAERISKALEDAKINGAPSWIIKRLRDELEDARAMSETDPKPAGLLTKAEIHDLIYSAASEWALGHKNTEGWTEQLVRAVEALVRERIGPPDYELRDELQVMNEQHAAMQAEIDRLRGEVAQALSANTVIHNDPRFVGEWVAIPEENFARLRAAIDPARQEAADNG